MKKQILTLDFDGVCHSYTSGWQGVDVIPDPPVDGLFPFLLEAQEHFEINIYSSRSSSVKGRWAMMDWFRNHYKEWLVDYPEKEGVELVLKYPATKPPAKVALDDRVLTFEGTWPDLETLIDFKPWNKK